MQSTSNHPEIMQRGKNNPRTVVPVTLFEVTSNVLFASLRVWHAVQMPLVPLGLVLLTIGAVPRRYMESCVREQTANW